MSIPTSEHIVVVMPRKVIVARKRAGFDNSYMMMAEATSEGSAEKIVEALNAQAKVQRQG